MSKSVMAQLVKEDLGMVSRAVVTKTLSSFWKPTWHTFGQRQCGRHLVQVESETCRSCHNNLDALRASIRTAWEKMDSAFVKKVCQQFRKQLERVITANGGHFEWVSWQYTVDDLCEI
jgi:hypothetical protein